MSEDFPWEPATGRDIAALLDPRPTIVIGARGMTKDIGFATIIWAMPISHKPPMVAIALRETSHTMKCLSASDCFSINVLPATEEAIELAQFCGTRTGLKIRKAPLVEHRFVPAVFDKEHTKKVQVAKKTLFHPAKYEEVSETHHIETTIPVVNCATSWMTCSVDHIEQAGDHQLIVANVLEAYTNAPRNEHGHLEPTDVLQCIQHDAFGKVYRMGEEPAAAQAAPPPPAAPAAPAAPAPGPRA